MFTVYGVYLWWCVVSLFHAIIVINSSEYRSLYGDNPFSTPTFTTTTTTTNVNSDAFQQTNNNNNVENVKIFSSPDSVTKNLIKKRIKPSNVKFQPITISLNDKQQNAPFYVDDYYLPRQNNRQHNRQNNRPLGYY